MKINATNLIAIEDAIISAEGKATARTTDAAYFPDWIKSAEKRLHELQIPKKYWAGCVIAHHPEEVNNSYKSRAEGTYTTITRFASGWFVTAIFRSDTGRCAYGCRSYERLQLSDLAHNNIPKQQYI